MERSHLVDAPFQGRGVVLGAIQLPSNWERLALAASTRPRRRRTRVPGLAAGEHGVPSTNRRAERFRSEEHTSELQSLMRISYAVFCLKKKKQQNLPAQLIIL